jgi:hypothetical protein
MPYEVLVDDNYDYMDESKRYPLGVYATYDEAVEAAKEIVDEFLSSAYKPGVSFEDLFGGYRGFGEDPFILATPLHANVGPLFSARGYAQERCRELCDPNRVTAEARPWWMFWRSNHEA